MFDLRRTLPKYLRTFLHENAVLVIGLTDQPDYSICHFMVIIFIHTVLLVRYMSNILILEGGSDERWVIYVSPSVGSLPNNICLVYD